MPNKNIFDKIIDEAQKPERPDFTTDIIDEATLKDAFNYIQQAVEKREERLTC